MNRTAESRRPAEGGEPHLAAGSGEPNPFAVLLAASLAGAVIVALWRFQHQIGAGTVHLFAKEGPLENVTFILEMAGAWWAASAVWQFSRKGALAPPPRIARWMIGALAIALFLVAMEEINWGQTLIGFGTPEAWKEVNYQQETSLHNLANKTELDVITRYVAVLMAAATIALTVVGVKRPRSILGSIAPAPVLIPLALCIAYAGVKQHPEVVEVLLSVFFAFYTYRLASLSRAQNVPLSQPALLESASDAIIIWEMGGGGVLYWNQAAERLYGYSREQAFGKVTHALLNTDATGGVQSLESALARYGVWVGELRHRTRQGLVVVVESRLSLLAQRNGKWVVLEVNRDITDREAGEETARAMETQLTRLRSMLDASGGGEDGEYPSRI